MSRGPGMRGAANLVALAVALVGLLVGLLPTLQPLLGAVPTCGYDNAFHLWRAVQISRLWDQGVLYSRWVPDMAHGFGFPLFIFASPFPPALTALLNRLGLAWGAAQNATFAVGMVLGSLGTFWLVTSLVREEHGKGAPAGVALAAGGVAALAYGYAPFQAYDVFNRGSLWEAFAWAFPPFVLMGVHRWLRYRERRALLLGVVALAAMILSHHVFAFLFGPLLALWVVVHAWTARDATALGRGALLGVLGLGVTAFFWLPPMGERSFIQTERLLGTWVFDYRYNFLSLAHLLALPRRADPRLLNDWPEKALGLVPVLIAGLSLIGLRRRTRERRWQIGLLWGLVVGMAVLTLPLSRPLWDRVPLLSYAQFPWRFLGPAAMCLALLTGFGAAAALEACRSAGAPGGGVGWGSSLCLVALAGLIVGSNLGWFYPTHCAAIADTSPAALIAWERATDTLGTTAKGEYLPVWVRDFPDAELDADYAAGGPIRRLRPESLPEGAAITRADYDATRAEIALTTPVAFRARYLAFYYPGWHVTVDGRAVPVAPEPDTGLLTFDVPAGTHTVEVWFGETALRWGADVGSILSVIVLAAVVLGALRPAAPGADERRAGSAGIGPRHAAVKLPLVLLGVAVTVLALKLLADRQGWLWRSSRLTPDGALQDVRLASGMEANFGNQARLLGVAPLPASVAADASPVVTLYWRALEPEPRDWQVGIALEATDGARHQAALRPARWSRTPPPLAAWPREDYARMDLHLDLPPGLPPGTYALELTLFDRQTAKPASVLGPDGNPLGPALSLGQIEVRRPAVPPTLAALGVDPEAEAHACGPVRLWLAEPSRREAAPGDLVTVRTVWEAVTDEAVSGPSSSAPLTMTLALHDGVGTVVRTWDLPPVAVTWPTTLWQPGDRWAGSSEIRLPGSLESGRHRLTLSLPGCDLASWELAVAAPERVWELPADFVPSDLALYGERDGAPTLLVRLAGQRLASSNVSPGETVDLALAWEALGEMATSYRVFVHLLAADGTMLAQNDGEPVGWTRPTTGWAVGEIIVDPRPLDVPATAAPGTYRIRAGLYTPDGPRLRTAEAEDGVFLGEVVVR